MPKRTLSHKAVAVVVAVATEDAIAVRAFGCAGRITAPSVGPHRTSSLEAVAIIERRPSGASVVLSCCSCSSAARKAEASVLLICPDSITATAIVNVQNKDHVVNLVTYDDSNDDGASHKAASVAEMAAKRCYGSADLLELVHENFWCLFSVHFRSFIRAAVVIKHSDLRCPLLF